MNSTRREPQLDGRTDLDTARTNGSDPLHDLALLIRSRYALIHLNTPEEERSETLLRHLADHLEVPFFVWRRNKGLQRADASGEHGVSPA